MKRLKILLILNQQQTTKQLTVNDPSRNQTTDLQRIGVGLHRYTTKVYCPDMISNGFYSYALRENAGKKAVTLS